VYATLEAITGQERQAVGGEDGYSLWPVFQGEATSDRETLISHSIDGSFAIRQGPWKLCLCGGSGGWSAPREGEAKQKGLPAMQLYNLAEDAAETKNLIEDEPEKVDALLLLLDERVRNGRSTPGEPLKNDRDVKFLPSGVTMPERG
jgi:arylsulfatase A